MPVTERILVMRDGGRTMSRSTFGGVVSGCPPAIECVFGKSVSAVDSVKVVPEGRRGDLVKIVGPLVVHHRHEQLLYARSDNRATHNRQRWYQSCWTVSVSGSSRRRG